MHTLRNSWRGRARDYRTLLIVSLPLMAGAISEVLTDQWDTFLQGRYSTEGLASISIGGSVFFGISIVVVASMIGQAALSAHSFGGKRPERVGRVLLHAMVLYGVLGLLLTLLLTLGAGFIAGLFNCAPEVCDGARDYMIIRGSGLLLFILYFLLVNVYAADTKTRYVLYAGLVLNVVHIVMTTPLVFGWWIFPELGVLGSALGGLIADVVATLYLVAVFFRERYHVRIRPATFRISRQVLGALIKLGMPTLVSVLLLHIAEWGVLAMIGLLGTEAFAAGHLVDNFVFSGFAILYGLCEGGQIMAGRFLGEGDWGGVKRLYRRNAELIFCLCLPILALLLAIPGPLLSIYTSDREIVELGVWPLRLGAFMLLATGWALNSVVFVRGLGKTLWDLITNAIAASAHIAGAYVMTLVLGWGLMGVFAAGIGFWMLRGSILLLFLRRLFKLDHYDMESARTLDDQVAEVQFAD